MESGSTTLGYSQYWISNAQWQDIVYQYHTAFALMAVVMVLLAFFLASHLILCCYNARKEREHDREPPSVIVIEPIPNDRPSNKSTKSFCEVPIKSPAAPASQRAPQASVNKNAKKECKEKMMDSLDYLDMLVSTPPTMRKVAELKVSTPPIQKPANNADDSTSTRSLEKSKSVSGSNERIVNSDSARVVEESMKKKSNEATTPPRVQPKTPATPSKTTENGATPLKTASEPASKPVVDTTAKNAVNETNIAKTTVNPNANTKKSTWV